MAKINWCYKHWFADGTPADTFILKTTYKDNTFLPTQYINTLEAMKESNPTYYKIYAEGEFSSLDKLIYNNWTVQEFDLKHVSGQTLVGLDFGYVNSQTALLWGKVDEAAKTIYIAGEVYQTGLLNDAIARQIQY